MKIGICESITNCLGGHCREADYIEIRADELCKISGEEFDAFRHLVDIGEITTYSCNCLFPVAERFFGETADMERHREYIKRTLSQLAELRVSTVVFGSGAVRNIPDGYPTERAIEELDEFGRFLSDTAAQYGQTIIVEPLNRTVTNFINGVADGAAYCRRVGRDNCRMLVDFYHFAREGNEALSVIGENIFYIKHAHIATPKKRGVPYTPADWDFFKTNLHYLQSIGYTGAISFEGGKHPVSVYNRMIRRMKRIVANYGK